MRKKINVHAIEAHVKHEATSSSFSKILVALSGGADSIATAFALKQAGIEIRALHCNFHLRGEESNRDATFVRDFCDKYDIPLEIKEFDILDYLRNHRGVSTEMACRDVRHKWFRDELIEKNFQRIATGHNADDNIETFFLNVLRGAGTRGLKGMIEDTGTIWRPILTFHRPEILEYLKLNNLNFIIDSTNMESDFRRNFLRNKVIPLMKEEWKGFDSALDKTIQNIQAENNLVEEVIKQSLPAPNQPISAIAILSSPSPLLMIKRFIDPLQPFTATPKEILSAIRAKKPHIRQWRLKNGMVFLRNGNLFIEIGHCESRT